MVAQEWFFNADFGFLWQQGIASNSKRVVVGEELSLQFIWAGASSDSVVVHGDIPVEFLEYLSTLNSGPAKTIKHPGFTMTSEFRPFGWNESMDLRSKMYRPDLQRKHPSPDVVRRVNGKQFSTVLARQIEPDITNAWEVHNVEQLRKIINNNSGKEFLLKTVHGQSGVGHKRIRSGEALPIDWMSRWGGEECPWILERWDRRIRDLGSHFYLDSHGNIQNLKMHELINTADGAFIGVLIRPDPWVFPERERLVSNLEVVGKALYKEGYFGPVGVDSYHYTDLQGQLKLRSLVEINARESMAVCAYGLQRRFPQFTFFLWRFYNSKKLKLTSNWKDCIRLTQQVEESIPHCQIIWTSPVYHSSPLNQLRGSTKEKFSKISLLFSSQSESSLQELMAKFESVFLKP